MSMSGMENPDALQMLATEIIMTASSQPSTSQDSFLVDMVLGSDRRVHIRVMPILIR